MIQSLERRIKAIEERNSHVELDKAWEISKTRRFFVALFTYLSISLYFVAIRIERPFINAVVPTIGFLLSTLSFEKYGRRNNEPFSPGNMEKTAIFC